MPWRRPPGWRVRASIGTMLVVGGLLALVDGSSFRAGDQAGAARSVAFPDTRAPAPIVAPSPRPTDVDASAGAAGEPVGPPVPTEAREPVGPPVPTEAREPPGPPAPTEAREGIWGSAVPLGEAAPEAVAPPVAVTVPAIGVASDLVELGVLPDGTLEVPDSAGQAGWFAAGARPGAAGPALIAGHVDLGGSPGVFQRLEQLTPGDGVEVRDADGAVRRFAVERVERYAKDSFPTDVVYGPRPDPVLHLVTCGGTFDSSTGHYRDNVIVTARPV